MDMEPRSWKTTPFGSLRVFDMKALFVSSSTKKGVGLELTGKGGRTYRVLIRMTQDEKRALAKQLLNDVL